MVEYIDSSTETRTEYIRHWLDKNLVATIESLRIQTGYFSYSAIEPYQDILREVIKKGRRVRLVIGSNAGSLMAEDTKSVLKLLRGKTNCSFTIVSLRNAEFHPKCYQITRGDTSQTALIGSGNFSYQGISLNIEAAIILDTRSGDDIAVINKIIDNIDKWQSANEDDGAYQIKTAQDIEDLRQSKIIDIGNLEARILSRKILLGRKKRKKELKKNLKRHWTFKRRSTGHRLGPSMPILPALPILPVLIAEIPRGGGRWKQANFDKDNFENFFGLTIGNTQQYVLLQHVASNGQLDVIERHQGVSVRSRNFRVELDAATGLAYPNISPPIAVFVRITNDRFRYRLLMPNDTDYSIVSSFLINNWSGRTDRMRRIVIDTRGLRNIWPNSPLWVRPF